MDKALRWFVTGWVTVVALLNLAAIAGFFLTASSLLEGWLRVTDIYSPYNVFNWIAELVTLSPAIAAELWRQKRRDHA